MGEGISLLINSKPTQMKKELFNLLVGRILAQPDLFSTHKVTIKEGLEVHTFGNVRNTDLAEAKALFKGKGYKMADVHTDASHLSRENKLHNQYLTILYGEDKDKISISTFEMGYALAYRKERYYPLRKNNPVLAYTQRMYGFKYMKKGKPLVRIQMGNVYVSGFGNEIGDIITKTLLGVDYIPQAKISYRHFINTKNDLQAMSNMFGVRVPEALKIYPVEEVLALYKTIKDFNQINKLCQFISKGSNTMEVDHPFMENGKSVIKLTLYHTIALMLFGNFNDEWLIRDAMGDGITLKKRNISLAVTSRKRWLDEHQKMTKLRMLKGIPEITVEEVFKNALTGLDHSFELIETKDRLVQESVELHHCVATYANKINTGRCAIFSINYEGEQYTLEVSVHAIGEDLIFTPVQFRGSCNKAAPDLIGKRVAEVLAVNKCKNPNIKKKQESPELIF
jgi:hypothetical protein